MDQFERFLLQLEDGAFAVDPWQRVVFWNPACERLLGVSARAALGQPCCEVVRASEASGERYCGARCGLGDLARGGAAPKPMPLWFAASDGGRQQLWVSILLVPSQRQDLWTVIHVLQRKPQTLIALPSDASGATQLRDKSAPARQYDDAPVRAPDVLTPREREVLALLALGHCVIDIARSLYLSPVTVRNHVQHLIAKLGLHSQLEAVAYAYRNDLVARAPRQMPVRQLAAARAS